MWFGYLVASVLAGFGIAVVLVQKQRDWPSRIVRVYLKHYLVKIHRRLPKMLSCAVCTSFWSTLVAEVLISLGTILSGHWPRYWAWPLSGFIAVGFTWVVMDFLISLSIISDKVGGITNKNEN